MRRRRLPGHRRGRIVATITMVIGISTFAVVTAKVAELLVQGNQTQTRHPAR